MATLLQPGSSLNTVLSVLLYNCSAFDLKKHTGGGEKKKGGRGGEGEEGGGGGGWGGVTGGRLKPGEESHLLAVASV